MGVRFSLTEKGKGDKPERQELDKVVREPGPISEHSEVSGGHITFSVSSLLDSKGTYHHCVSL